MPENSNNSTPIFYGWKVVAALFVMLMFSSGLGFYNNSIMLQALSQDGTFSIEVASTAVSLFFFVSGVTGLAIAPVLERFDVRLIVLAGALLSCISLMLIGQVSSLAGLFIAYSVFGAGFAASSLLPSTTLVARWFEANRAKALSVASTGLSLGGMTLTPLSALLVESFPLPQAAAWMGGLYFAGVASVCLVLRSFPRDLGLNPDGAAASSSSAIAGITLGSAVSHSYFWLLSISYVFVMAGQVGGIAHQYGLLTERMTLAQASLGIAILPTFSVLGRLAGGWLLDFFPIRRFTLGMMLCQGIALALLAAANSVPLIYASLALFGITVGNLLMLQPLILAEIYGLKHYPQIYAWSHAITVLGVAGGPALMGFLYASAADYQFPYLVGGLLGALAAFLYFIARPPRGTDD